MTATPAFDKRQVENLLPLLPLQQGLLFHSLLSPDGGSYVPQVVLTLQGELDPAALRQAWADLLARHAVLRSSFHWEQRDEPFQVHWRSAVPAWLEQDWSNLPAPEQAGRLQALLAAQRAQPFDLRRPPLMRLALLKLAPQRHQLIWCHHHLLLDGWSASLLLRELFLRLRGLPLPPAPRPYADFVAWHQQRQAARPAARAAWQQALHRVQPAPAWPLLAAPPRHGRAEPAHATLALGAGDSAALRSFARSQGLTLATVLQASVGLLHRRYGVHADGRPDDIVFGHTVAGRPPELPGALDMVGLFINTVPLRLSLPAGEPLRVALQRLQAQQAETAALEALPLRELQALAAGHPTPADGTAPAAAPALFDTLLVIENYPAGSVVPGLAASNNDEPAADTPRLQLQGLRVDEATHYGLTLQVADGDQLTLAARWDGRRAAPAVMQALLQHWRQLLLQMPSAAGQVLSDIGMLTAAERTQIDAWEDGGPGLAQAGDSLATRFEAQVRQRPGHTALRFEGRTLSYAELDRRANRLAWRLQARGVGPEGIVALQLARSLDLMVALLAVQKAGAAYLPLDPDQPPARAAAMLADARPQVLLRAAGQGLAAPAPLPAGMVLLDLDDKSAADGEADTPPPRADHPLQAAYLIYTSGSTGQPKGVLNHQAGISNRLRWMQQHLQLTPADKVLQKTPLGFDVSVWELFWPLLEGATLVLAPPGVHRDRDALAALIADEAISVLHFVPAMLADFLRAPAAAASGASLRQVVCSGEALPPALARQALQAWPAARLHNLYGPTEAAVDVSAWVCSADDGDAVPIGRPIAGLRLRVLDADGQPVPAGVRGRLFIGGDGLARGYRGRPALTAERFAPDDQGRLLYDSGDLARWRDDGALLYLGRADAQFKLRGVRIEAGEVEAALLQLAGVRQALVRPWGEGEAVQLAAAVVLDPALHPPDIDPAPALQQALRAQLPEAMVPALLQRLEALPLGPNGKPDRRALPPPTRAARAAAPPQTEVQQQLAAIWQETLPPDPAAAPLGLDDSFFERGGHSLVAMRIVARIRQRLGVDLPLVAVFEHPTLRALAAQVDRLRAPQPAADYKEVEL